MRTICLAPVARRRCSASISFRAAPLLCLLLAGCGTTPEAHYQKGKLLLKQNKLPEAMREAEAGMRQEPSWRFRILVADIFLTRSDGKDAAAVLAFAPPPADPESLARVRMAQGWAENLAANYSAASALLQQASDIARPLNIPSLEATIDLRLGVVQVSQGRMDLAETTLRRAIAATAGRDPYLNATAMANLGFLFLNSFHLEEAILWFSQASPVFQQLGSTVSYYVTQGNLGVCYQRLGDSEKALAYFQQAEDHARQIGDRQGEQRWIGNTGSVLYDRDDLPRAKQKFEQALAIAQSLDRNEKDLTGWWYYSLATVSIDLGELDQAEAYNREALLRRQAIGNHSDFYPRVNEAHIAAGRKDPRAEALYRGLIAEYRQGMNPVPMLEAEAGLAELLAAKGQFAQADAQFRSALSDLELQRTALSSADHRMTYLAKLIRFYDRYIDFLVERGQTEKALEAAESSRARVLDERLESKAPRQPVGAARLRELARDSHTAFLSYWLGKKQSFLWAVTPQGIELHRLPKESEIAFLVAGYRSFIENLRDPLQSEFPAARKLAETLLGPVRPLLEATNRIVVVPDRSLHSLNFETLPDPRDPMKYFIERTTVTVAPSLNLLAQPRAPANRSSSLLLIGNPQQAVEEYPSLPFAATEIELISKAASRNEIVLEGSHAYPGAYRDAKPAQFSWIHFAAHAAANQTTPLDSALILSRAPGAEG